ncbi:MAG: response regulator [Pyrinomonadaceae bacterium]|nr:response regulator [Pyrinomonadaceae bacterium]
MINQNQDGNAVSEILQGNPDDVSPWDLAPQTDWRGMSDSEHFVQFYEADAFLLNSLSGFIGAAINSGDGALVVATDAHREGLDELLRANGLDLISAKARGQYVSLDAAETLSQFMVDGSPEPRRFNKVIGNVIESVTDGRTCVRAFGEMVALLWAEGNYAAAIRLEELWSDLQKNYSFSLFCAYPMNGFSGEKFVQPLTGVCTAHSRVIPAEGYADLVNHDDRLRAIIQLQQKAKTLQAEIRQREEAQEELRASLVREQMARAEAESANRMKDEFLATVSHELRTPLNAIMGWSHMLRSGRLDQATMARAFETIDRNAKSQAQLIEDILDASRVITGRLRLNLGPVDVASVINSAIDSVQLAADSKGIQLEVTLDPSVRHTLGDSSRLQQVVWNLLANAIKFTPSGGRVEVRVERANAALQVCVSDTGQGISAEFLPFIFDRFRQADSTSTRAHGGLGLGLSIVRHLVELHGGSVEAQSAGLGSGTTFLIRLPLAVNKDPAKARKKRSENWPPENTQRVAEPLHSLEEVRVLLVDDDQDSLRLLATMLSAQRAKVETAASAAEALQLLEWFKPDVLVSDLAMPGEDGYSLIGKLRAMENLKHTPAVALTAYVQVEDRTRALSAGFNMFVPKPVDPNELIAAIANLAEPEPDHFEQA